MMSLKYKPLILLLATGLSACTQGNEDLYAYIEETKSKHLGSVQPLPTFKPYKNFTYSATDLKDPFEAPFEQERTENTSNLRPDASRPKELLEAYPLDTLRMVGILTQKKNTWGLVKGPNNVVHRVQTGGYVGQNQGQIVAVTEKQIDIIETIPDGVGGYIEREASLAIGSN
ncbi:Type IV pilus biogenesis protein PilP [hydrothermal vent metagenome]|uniref:Type IV pilus biogenesis protein PilP n=1 Tax=hydrothermal vent metagenome TaxID=652676 RepID=A0A3B0XJM3_9ZZZZ